MKVQNMVSSRGVKAVKQFILSGDKEITFQSYNSIIATKRCGKVFLDSHYWDYSKTAGRYRNIFLGENKKETEKKIKSGEYTLTNLN